jgi:RHS repeat-associated protein
LHIAIGRRSVLSAQTSITSFNKHSMSGLRQVVGAVGPDPDGSGPLRNRATRNTYDADGLLTQFDRGTANSESYADWSAMSVLQSSVTVYDSTRRKTQDQLLAGGSIQTLTQFSYDADGRMQCATQRMNPIFFSSLPPSACTAGTAGTYGPDRIKQTSYDAADEVTEVQSAVGTALQRNDFIKTYTPNGKVQTEADARGDLTMYTYDGFDRLSKTQYPTPGNGAVSSTTDYEQFQYDANFNLQQKRLRDGLTITYGYDNLNRQQTVAYSDSSTSVTDSNLTNTYDNLNRLHSSSDANGHFVVFGYDALSRKLTEVSAVGTKSSQYDLAGRRTKLTWPDGLYVGYDYLLTDEMLDIRENGATSGVGLLATFSYDNLGRRTALTRGNGTVTSYLYDGASRMTQLNQDLAGTATDQTQWFGYNPANQLIAQTRSNNAYAWTRTYNYNSAYSPNGLNQYTAVGSVAPSYDGRGNLVTGIAGTYGYNSKNQLWSSSSNGVTFYYDPAGRLDRITASGGATWTVLDYDGDKLITEISNINVILRRYVHGPEPDEPLVWYEGTGTSDRRWLHADERGSVTAISNASGAALTVNSYDEYGVPQGSNSGRFQYTGQAWVAELGMYYYKARFYSPMFGRFLQTDPVGYKSDPDLYSYVNNDPTDKTDPTGMCEPQSCIEGSGSGPAGFDSGVARAIRDNVSVSASARFSANFIAGVNAKATVDQQSLQDGTVGLSARTNASASIGMVASATVDVTLGPRDVSTDGSSKAVAARAGMIGAEVKTGDKATNLTVSIGPQIGSNRETVGPRLPFSTGAGYQSRLQVGGPLDTLVKEVAGRVDAILKVIKSASDECGATPGCR